MEAERHQLILELLKTNNTVKLQELVELTNTSESTIRRDLTQLEQRGFLKRVHGGAARLQGKLLEPTMTEKSSKNLHEKQKIAKYAASLVTEGESIYLDSGSTVIEMIPFLPENIVVVTNGFMNAGRCLERGIKTFLTGGMIKPTTHAMIGRGAIEGLKNYHFDKCFIGTNGIHHEFGFTTPDQEEALIKHLAISLSREAFVVADHSKFKEISFAKIADLSEATIITDKLDKEEIEFYSNKTNIKVAST